MQTCRHGVLLMSSKKEKCLEFHVLPDGGVACAERDTGMALRLRLKIDVNVLRLIVARY